MLAALLIAFCTSGATELPDVDEPPPRIQEKAEADRERAASLTFLVAAATTTVCSLFFSLFGVWLFVAGAVTGGALAAVGAWLLNERYLHRRIPLLRMVLFGMLTHGAIVVGGHFLSDTLGLLSGLVLGAFAAVGYALTPGSGTGGTLYFGMLLTGVTVGFYGYAFFAFLGRFLTIPVASVATSMVLTWIALKDGRRMTNGASGMGDFSAPPDPSPTE